MKVLVTGFDGVEKHEATRLFHCRNSRVASCFSTQKEQPFLQIPKNLRLFISGVTKLYQIDACRID